MAIGKLPLPYSHLRTIINEPRRSPSPPPQYDNFGRRVNTREYRYRKRLEDERHKQIEKAMKIIPNYHPPADYRRPTKTQEKVYVPVNDYPEINFSMITNPLTPNLVLSFYCFLLMLTALCGGLALHNTNFPDAHIRGLLSLNLQRLTHRVLPPTNSWTSHRSSW